MTERFYVCECPGAPPPSRAKYGQWAPNMEASLFESLLNQARRKGWLTNSALK